MMELQRQVKELRESVAVSQGQASASGSTRMRVPKMATPQVFTGKMVDVRSFQTACYLYIIAKPEVFLTENSWHYCICKAEQYINGAKPQFWR
jgi:hypothetical protein